MVETSSGTSAWVRPLDAALHAARELVGPIIAMTIHAATVYMRSDPRRLTVPCSAISPSRSRCGHRFGIVALTLSP